VEPIDQVKNNLS